MPITQLEPPAAHEFLERNANAIYLDVRTEGEFEKGHPSGAVNVPVVFIKGPGQMEPNDEFLTVVEKAIPKDRKLVIGCMSGGRSQRACEMLEQAGYTNLVNVRGGFGGMRDASGAVVTPGWRDAGLPVSTDLTDSSYGAMRARAGV